MIRHEQEKGGPGLDRRIIREAVVDWIERSGCSWCVTLNPNRALPLSTELSVLRLAFGDADQRLLGRRYNRVDARKRLLAFIFPEHVHSNLHFHLALKPGPSAEPDVELERVQAMTSAWAARVPSGTFLIEPAVNAHGWGRYVTKEFHRADTEFVMSSMWWPERQRRHVLESSWDGGLSAAA